MATRLENAREFGARGKAARAIPDNLNDVVIDAAAHSGIAVGQAKECLAFFFRNWTGPAGCHNKPNRIVADEIEAL